MARKVKKLEAFRKTVLGRIVEAAVYAAMLYLALLYFTGSGMFLYEAF